MSSDAGTPLEFDSSLCQVQIEPTASTESVYDTFNSNFGHKTIGRFGSFVYLVNQIFGPGILALPLVIVRAGWLASSVVNVCVCFASCLAASRLLDAIRMMPGNVYLSRRVEYADAVSFYWGPSAAGKFRVLLHLTLQSLNIASIVDTALACDNLFQYFFGATFALEFYPTLRFHAGSRAWIHHMYDGDTALVLAVTAGYVLVLALCIPMGFYNLDENITIQIVSFVFLALLMAEFVAQCAFDFGRVDPPHPIAPAMIGSDFSQLLSVYVMSYSFGMLIMPWANEAKATVKAGRWIWISGLCSCVGYGVIGVLLAACFPHINTDNVLERLLARDHTLLVTKAAAYAFACTIILPGIPVFCIATRYDLLASGLCGPKASMFWGNIAPWLLSWALSSSGAFSLMLTWTSLIAGSLVNFVLPLCLYRSALFQNGLCHGRRRTDATIAVVICFLLVAVAYQFR